MNEDSHKLPRRPPPSATARSANRPLRSVIRSYADEAYTNTILDAAERLILEGGFHTVVMSQIGEKAGVAVGTLYKYFDSKAALLAKLVQRRSAEFTDALATAAQGAEPPAALEALVREALAQLERHGALFALIRVDARADVADVRASYAMFLRALEEALGTGAACGAIRGDLDRTALALAIMGTLEAHAVSWVYAGRPPGLSERAELILQLFMEGARPR